LKIPLKPRKRNLLKKFLKLKSPLRKKSIVVFPLMNRSTRPTNSKMSNASGTEENLNPNIPSTTHKRKEVPTTTRTGVQPTKTLQKPVLSQRVVRGGNGVPPCDTKTLQPTKSSSSPTSDTFVNTMAGMSDALNHISTMILSLQQNLVVVPPPSSCPPLIPQQLTTNGNDFNTAQCQEDLRQFSDKIHEMVKVNEEMRSKYKLEIEVLNSKINLTQTQLSDAESTLRTLRTENYDHRMAIDVKSTELERINVEIKKNGTSKDTRNKIQNGTTDGTIKYNGG